MDGKNFVFDLQRFEVTGTGTQADPYVVTNADDLKTAIENKDSYVKLNDDIEITSYLKIASKKTVTLDLNGKTITYKGSAGDVFDVSGTFIVNDSTGGGKISNAGTTGTTAAIYMYSAGKFIMNGGSIESAATVNIKNTGTVTINGGTFKSNDATNESFIISKIGENKYTYLDGAICVGTEEYVNSITSNSSYTPLEIDGKTKYYSTPEPAEAAKVASIGTGDDIKYYSLLQYAFDAASANDTVKVIKNVALSTSVNITKNITLDLNGKTVSKAGNNAFYVKNKATLTIDDSTTDKEGKISGTSSVVCAGSSSTVSGTLVLKNGTIEATNGSGVYVYKGSTANIEGGSITGTTNVSVVSGGTASITGGTFSSDVAQYIAANTNSIFLDGTLYVGASADGKDATDNSLNLDGQTKYYSTPALLTEAGESAVASIGSGDSIKYYTSLQNAIDGASADDTIVLTKDITLSSAINVTKQFTLDLNGKTLTKGTATAPIICVKTLSGSQGNLTLKDSGTGGKVNGTLYVGESSTSSGTFTLESGTVQTTNQIGIYVYGGSTANINGGTVTGSNYAIGVASGGNVSVANDLGYSSATIDGTTRYYDTEEKYNTAISGAVAYIERDENKFYYNKFSDAYSALQDGETVEITEKGLSTAAAYIDHDGKRTYYDSLSKAFDGSTDKDTVVLCNDITTATTFIKKWTVTLDLAGHTICPTSTNMDGFVLRVDAPANNESKGHLIIDDSVGGGTIGGANYGYGIYVSGYQKKNTSGSYVYNVPAQLTVNA